MERNNMFKYATKELSQDAFICWCINWINYKEHKLYNLGKEMLKEILFPDLNDENLYPYYEKNELIEHYEIFNDRNNKKENDKTKELEKKCSNLNSQVDLIKKDLNKNINKLKKLINLDKTSSIKINRQFHRMDIVITIDNEFVVIIEDKINGTTNDQLQRYINVLKDIVQEDKKEDIEILDLDINKFDKTKIIPVYMKTGCYRFEEKLYGFNSLNGFSILKVLKNYINESDIIQDFYTCLDEKVKKENPLNYKDIIKKGYIKIGTKFQKRYMIFNCFKKYTLNTYISGKTLVQNCGYELPNTNVRIWTPRLYNYQGWINTLEENGEIIVEEKINKLENRDFEDNCIRYVFPRRRDTFNQEYFECIGAYVLDKDKSNINKRIWRKLNIGENLPIDVDKLENK